MASDGGVKVGYSNGKPGCQWNEETCYVDNFESEQLSLAPQLLRNLQNKFKKNNNAIGPLILQRYALLPAFNGEDVNVLSATGSGKTLCYLLPIINGLLKMGATKQHSIIQDRPIEIAKRYRRYSNNVHQVAPEAVILVPTRELAIQVAEIARDLVAQTEIRVQAFWRDSREKRREARERKETSMLGRSAKGINIMISTLGYINYLRRKEATDFSRLSFLVFDEADELFSENFRREVTTFMTWAGFIKNQEGKNVRVSSRHANCQVMMFAADFDPKIEEHARMYFRNYLGTETNDFQTVKVRAQAHINTQGDRQVNSSINEKITQEIIEATNYSTNYEHRDHIVRDQAKNKIVFERLDQTLKTHLRNGKCCKTLIFIEQRRDVENLFKVLSDHESENDSSSWKIGYLHGDCTQKHRNSTVDDFNRGMLNVIVSTSLGARGLDIQGINLVINYILPECTFNSSNVLATKKAHYIYRIGRTGREGQTGNNFHAVSFFSPENDKDFAPILLKYLVDSNTPIPDFLPKLVERRQQLRIEQGRNSQHILRNMANLSL